MKKSQTTSGKSAKHIKKWKYEEEISFLRPHMRERDTISSLNILSDGENETNDESGIVEVEDGDNDLDINSSDITHLTNTESPTTSSSENKVRSQKLTLGQKELNKTNMRKRKQPTESASATLMESFFLSIASTVKKFTPYNQSLAKVKIFSIVSDLEFNELKSSQEQQYQSGNTPSSEFILPQLTQVPQPYLHPLTHEISNPTIQNIQYDSTASSSSCGSYLHTFSP
ncbi:hypothetical protein QTP88_001572 [Uroleucon formosanum]